ncbi:MAG: hypothetical protein HY453_01975 [Parcubacteria group bacterium]|nr:hypothetical protein [Parcubacteria group bacterium]
MALKAQTFTSSSMKVVAKDDVTMTLRKNNYGAYFLGAVFLFAGVSIVRQVSQNIEYFMAFLMLGFGVLVIATNKRHDIRLDKLGNMGTVRVSSLFGNSITEFFIKNIESLFVAHASSYKGKTYYNLAFRMKDASAVSLTPEENTIMATHVQTARDIAAFLGVPFEEPSSLSGSLKDTLNLSISLRRKDNDGDKKNHV